MSRLSVKRMRLTARMRGGAMMRLPGGRRIQPLYFVGFPAALTADHFKRHVLPFHQSTVAVGGDGGEMLKNFVSGTFCDEPEAFGVIEPFYFATCHNIS